MHGGVKVTLAFILGAAAGTAVTWKMLKEKYEQLVREEIDSFKEMIKTKYDVSTEQEPDWDTDTVGEYTDLADVYKTTDEKGGDKPVEDRSYITVIPPDEFAEDESYDTETLILYSDGVLADDRGNIVEDIDDVVGLGSLETFGEYEEDSVFVRNEKYKCEYEVVKDFRRFSDVAEGNA